MCVLVVCVLVVCVLVVCVLVVCVLTAPNDASPDRFQSMLLIVHHERET